MPKYLVNVTRFFCEEVEADSAEEAEDLVSNMNWFDIPQDIDIEAVLEQDAEGNWN